MQAERRLRELRGRIKAARAAVATTPGLAALLRNHWPKAAYFYARFGINEALFRYGASADMADGGDDFFGHDVGGWEEWK